eukprot:7850074-Pyramimonas_sp.AAC.1
MPPQSDAHPDYDSGCWTATSGLRDEEWGDRATFVHYHLFPVISLPRPPPPAHPPPPPPPFDQLLMQSIANSLA